MKTPLISIIIPLFNGQKHIREALDSIYDQKYSNIEIIIVDDGSTDNSIEIIRSINKDIKIISQENKGPSIARNTGIKNANGNILAFLDCDDKWSQDHFNNSLCYLSEDYDFDIVRGHSQIFRLRDSNKISDDSNDISLYEILELKYYWSLIGSAIYKASIFEKVGLFDEKMRFGEDLDWHNRFRFLNGKEKRLESTSLFYRRHEGNMTNSHKDSRLGMFEAIRKNVHRFKS